MITKNRALLVVLFTLGILVLSPVEMLLGDEPVIEIIVGEDGF